METSDESFVWTDASSDSSINMVAELTQTVNECSEGETYKNKLHNNMQPETAMVEHKQRNKKRKKTSIDDEGEQEFQMNRSIKSEPNSDFDTPQTKKKTKDLENISNHYNESYRDAENYLNLRVKQEQMSFVEPAAKKSKKKKHKDGVKSIEEDNSQLLKPSKNKIDNEEHILNASSLDNYENCNSSETEIISHRKKKKKKIKEKLSLNENTSEIEHSEDTSKSKKKKVKRKSGVSKELIEDNSESENGEIVSSTLINNSTRNNNIENPNSNTHNDMTLLNTTELENQISVIEGPLKSSCRISDRIRFEEDSADFESNEYVHSEQLSIHLKQFINTSSGLMALSPNVQRDSVITEDDEVWLLKTPHEISIGDLDKASLTLDGKRKIKVNGKTYDSFINNSISAAPILLSNKNNFFIKNVPLMGVVNLRKRIPKVHIPYETLVVHTEGGFIPLPDTKCRHPLFGINYKKATKIPKNVAERLNATEAPTISTDVENKKKKKHKKVKREIESDVDVKPKVEEARSSKKKRKRKHSEEGASRAKRAKHAPDDWASERAIEENLFHF